VDSIDRIDGSFIDPTDGSPDRGSGPNVLLVRVEHQSPGYRARRRSPGSRLASSVMWAEDYVAPVRGPAVPTGSSFNQRGSAAQGGRHFDPCRSGW
jgi:hypothetical protein